jgi:hypothetical protein
MAAGFACRQALTHMAVGVSDQHTSVPRWAAEPPEIDATGRRFLVVSSGAPGREVAEDWCARIEALGRPLWSHHVADRSFGLGADEHEAVPAVSDGGHAPGSSASAMKPR